MTVTVAGNVIEFDGYHIARISTAVPATVRDRFESALDNAYEEGGELPEAFHEGLDKLFADIKAKAEAGMVEMSDIETIFNELKANQ